MSFIVLQLESVIDELTRIYTSGGKTISYELGFIDRSRLSKLRLPNGGRKALKKLFGAKFDFIVEAISRDSIKVTVAHAQDWLTIEQLLAIESPGSRKGKESALRSLIAANAH